MKYFYQALNKNFKLICQGKSIIRRILRFSTMKGKAFHNHNTIMKMKEKKKNLQGGYNDINEDCGKRSPNKTKWNFGKDKREWIQ